MIFFDKNDKKHKKSVTLKRILIFLIVSYKKSQYNLFYYKLHLIDKQRGIKVLDLDKVFERMKGILAHELGSRKILDKDIAQALNITQSNLGALKSRDRIPVEEVMDFCIKRNISINWLLYDQEDILNSKEKEPYAQIKYFDNVNCSAGGGSFNYEENFQYINVDHTLINILGLDIHKDIEAINVFGDSMSPTVPDNSVVFLNKRNKDITKGGVFAINTPYGLFLKRVQVSLKTKEVELVSDNKNYSSEFVPLEDVNIIGKAVGIIYSLS